MHGTVSGGDREGATPSARPSRVPLVLRLAMRELRGGLSGFGIFLACIALGVMAIAGVSSVSRALTEGLAREGRTLLGGDLSYRLIHREATPAEIATLEEWGDVSVVATMRGMANAETGAALVEIKAVDEAYPIAGELVTEPALPPSEIFARAGDAYGAAVDPVLLGRLDLEVGDTIRVGTQEIVLRTALRSEPDKIQAGIDFGPRLLVSREALDAMGLIQPGSLVRFTYRVDLDGPPNDDALLARAEAAIQAAQPQAGWEARSRLNANPELERNIERFAQFLTLVGLTALIVGGVGVANAVRGFVDRKRESIATLKSLGAPGGRVVGIYLTQVMTIAGIGILIGLALGAAMPFALAALLGAILPIPIAPTLAPLELALAALYGVLTALAFSLAPLGRAHDIQVSGLFRDQIDPDRRFARKRYLAGVALAIAALLGLSVFAAFDRMVALIFIGAAAAAFVLLRVVATGMMAIARRLPRPRAAAPRLALSNVHRPGALTPSLVLSLGLGITLLVALAMIDGNMRRQLTETLPGEAPSFFFVDIPSAEVDGFVDFLRAQAPQGEIERVPMLRGRLVSLRGVPVEEIEAEPDAAWVLEGDRGITYETDLPEGSQVVAGEWWDEIPQENLVSFDDELAAGLGLSVGDEVVVNVLGRDIEATISNLRKVEWESLGINFVMVFSPNTFAGAPHSHLATLALPDDAASEATEVALLREAARTYPMVTSVRVKDALEAVNAVVEQLVLAIRGASSIAVVASVLVLAGALAAGHRARLYDAVVLKTLGATRAKLVGAYALEYGILGLATAVFGLVAGGLAGWVIVTQIMRLDFVMVWSGPLAAAAIAIVVTVTFGLVGTWRILSQKPAPYLRTL
ncbi:ABC transporter permease [Salinarimonas ramus]|uniref:ABC transporter permease n=1 Tax=Salinarimonas ramus TaxID=690164 RepID=A0A917V483_9HYPH|nr:ABC transporter permease [Salinarimonas ramus]GGK37449.1 ABC transporter permease [Salinarimonas ramus]